MSVLEIIIVGIYIIGFFSMVLTFWDEIDLPALLGAYTILYSIIALVMWGFSCFQTSESMISSNTPKILRVVENETALQFDYVGAGGLAKSVKFDDMSTYLKYKEGKVLHIEEYTQNTYFGPDLNRESITLK